MDTTTTTPASDESVKTPKHPPRIVPKDIVHTRAMVILTNDRNKRLNKILKKAFELAEDGDADMIKFVITLVHGKVKNAASTTSVSPTSPATPNPAPLANSTDLLARLGGGTQSDS